jgi:hypothetical protein
VVDPGSEDYFWRIARGSGLWWTQGEELHNLYSFGNGVRDIPPRSLERDMLRALLLFIVQHIDMATRNGK